VFYLYTEKEYNNEPDVVILEPLYATDKEEAIKEAKEEFIDCEEEYKEALVLEGVGDLTEFLLHEYDLRNANRKKHRIAVEHAEKLLMYKKLQKELGIVPGI
jgi:adenylyl- and sulfurtransferase ThiI